MFYKLSLYYNRISFDLELLNMYNFFLKIYHLNIIIGY